jgi:hypothetical protein
LKQNTINPTNASRRSGGGPVLNVIPVVFALSYGLGAVTLVFMWRAANLAQQSRTLRRNLWAATILYLLALLFWVIGLLVSAAAI